MWNKNPKLGKPQHTTQILTPLLIISFENGNYAKKLLRGSTTQKVVIVKLSIKGCVCSRGCIRIIWSSASVDIFKGDGKWREIEVAFSNTGGKSQIKILKFEAFWSDASVLPGGLVVSSNSSDWLLLFHTWHKFPAVTSLTAVRPLVKTWMYENIWPVLQQSSNMDVSLCDHFSLTVTLP